MNSTNTLNYIPQNNAGTNPIIYNYNPNKGYPGQNIVNNIKSNNK